MMAPMSSTIASASRKSLSWGATRRPSRAITPTAIRDVRRHGNAPTVAPAPAGVERDVDERRHHHAADRGNHRQRGLARVPELAFDELAFDLEADDEEEHRHEPVVHPLPQRE